MHQLQAAHHGMVVHCFPRLALAGFVDAIVGGGGLILDFTCHGAPARPTTTPPRCLAAQERCRLGHRAFQHGSSASAFTSPGPRCCRPWKAPADRCICRAWAVTEISWFLQLPSSCWACCAWQKLGTTTRPRLAGRAEMLTASAIGLLIGLRCSPGPGTGSFFVFLFVRTCWAMTFSMPRPTPSC